MTPELHIAIGLVLFVLAIAVVLIADTHRMRRLATKPRDARQCQNCGAITSPDRATHAAAYDEGVCVECGEVNA